MLSDPRFEQPEQPGQKVQVREVMNPEVVMASPATKVGEARRLLDQELTRYIVIVDDGDVVGIVSASDLGHADLDEPLAARMRAPVLGICERASVDEALRLMNDTGLGCLPVFWHDGSLLGLVTRNEVDDAAGC
jgi:osmoprotectant transport system ATP-binding protein